MKDFYEPKRPDSKITDSWGNTVCHTYTIKKTLNKVRVMKVIDIDGIFYRDVRDEESIVLLSKDGIIYTNKTKGMVYCEK